MAGMRGLEDWDRIRLECLAALVLCSFPRHERGSAINDCRSQVTKV